MSVLHQIVPMFFMIQFVLVLAGMLILMLSANPQA